MTAYRTFPSAFTRMGEPIPDGKESALTHYTTRKGREFSTSLTDAEAYKGLAVKTSDFAKSLARDGNPDLDESRGLSYEMWLWVHILANEPERKKRGPLFEDAPLTKLVEHFDRAAGLLKFPKVSLETEDGAKLRLSRSGPRAKFPGTINLTDGRPYGENEWYGRVLKDGTVDASRAFNDSVKELLVAFNEDPVKVAKTSGILTGNCCFCRRELTTGESLTAGYGPVCADNYGLPWGEVDPGVRDLKRYLPEDEKEESEAPLEEEAPLSFEAHPGVRVDENANEVANANYEIAESKRLEAEHYADIVHRTLAEAIKEAK